MNECTHRLGQAGIGYDDATALRRISMTLNRWCELECGDGNDYASWSIERDEATDIPYRCVYPHTGDMYRTRTPDREKGALKRLAVIMDRYPAFVSYYQTDPRGASLYIVPRDRLDEGDDLSSVYTRGIAVYK